MFFPAQPCILSLHFLFLHFRRFLYEENIVNSLISPTLSIHYCFSPISQCYADNDTPSNVESPVSTPCVDEGSDDDF